MIHVVLTGPSLAHTTHRHSSVMPAAIYLSIGPRLLSRSALRQVGLLATEGRHVAIIHHSGISAIAIMVPGIFSFKMVAFSHLQR